MLRIQCFGQLAVRRGDEPVGGAAMQPRRLAILAILARAGARGIPRDTVLKLLWPDEDEERGKRVLSQAIYMLRRDLGSDEVIDGGRILTLSASEISSDVHEFERAISERKPEEAVRAYEGPFLDGFSLSSAPEFMRWVDDSRDALALTYGQALEQAALSAAARNDVAEAAVLWRKRAGSDPLDGRIARELMEALERAGDRAGAIRHASIHAAIVQQELGVEADKEVLAYAESLKTKPIVQVFQTPAVGDAATSRTTPSGSSAAASQDSERDPNVDFDPSKLKRRATDLRRATDTPQSITPQSVTPVDVSVHSVPSVGELLVTPLPHTHINAGAATAKPSSLTRTEQHRVAVTSAWRKGAFAGGLALLAVASIFFFTQNRDIKPGSEARRVLVTPLANRTGDTSLDPYGLMIAEWITQGLSRTGLVEVVDARSMVETMRDDAAPIGASEQDNSERTRAMAARLGAGTVVAGTVYKDGDTLVINVRIVDPTNGQVRASVRPLRVAQARATSALEPLREQVSGVLAVLFDVRLNHTGATGSEPPTYEAYSEYLQGMQKIGRDNAGSLPHFVKAAELDTSFSQAKLWQAQALANTRRYRESDSVFSLLEKARDRLAPYDAASLDYFHSGFVRGNWQQSNEAAKHMRELAPKAAHAAYAVGVTSIFLGKAREGSEMLGSIDITHGWGREWAPRLVSLQQRAYEALGDYDKALELAKKLREIDPASGWQRVAEMRVLARTRSYKELATRLAEAMTLPATSVGWEPYEPGDMLHQVALASRFVGDDKIADSLVKESVRWYAAHPGDDKSSAFSVRGRGRTMYTSGNYPLADSLFRSLATSPRNIPEDFGWLGLIAARTGARDSAKAMATRLQHDTAQYRFGQSRTWSARIFAVLENNELAVSLLRDARREGFTRLYDIQVDPAFVPLRTLPGYRDFMTPYQVMDGNQDRTSRPRS